MFHIELRQFPHNFCRFNLTERELRTTVLDAWVRGERIELGGRSWDPQQACLIVLDGPQLPVADLTMGRGWRSAQRRGSDVTERMLALVRDEHPAPSQARPGQPQCSHQSVDPADVSQSAARDRLEPLVAQLISLLGDDPLPLMRAWQLALERHPDRTPSECLALAEELVRR